MGDVISVENAFGERKNRGFSGKDRLIFHV